MSREKILIFDFDGTIVDSKQAYYHALEQNLLPSGFSRKQIDKAIDIGLSVSETLKKLGFNFFLRLWLKRRIMSSVLRKVNEIKKCKFAETIKNIKARKILVSNSLKEFILPVLKHLKIKNEFSEIYSADDFDDKEEFISGYLRKNKINRENCFYVGDRVADVKLARKIGIKSVIISGKCAWDSKKEILKEKPDFVIFDLADLREII